MKKTALKTVPLEIAKEMAKEFKRQLSSNDDTRSVWFSIAQISEMVENLKKESADGLRVYFGRYTEDTIRKLNEIPNADAIPAAYSNRNTVIFVSTHKKGGKDRVDYFDEKDYHSMIPENRGILCPPHTGCDPDSEMLKE
ncbi:MAG: hypothetical protein EOP00_16690 [Pedobacter sp.]|nr:MAG: hypothetical protein EOP00_16690 [Pedobacter sp.]